MNIEIIPNWHPIFVHFTIGLLSISTLFYLTSYILKKETLFIAARWNLWIGAAITIGTVLAGLYAYNTVAHDASSHAAMTDHRNWALPTVGLFLILALWAGWKQRGTKTVSLTFVVVVVLASALLAVTGYKGGEVVYRHGIGVMKILNMEGDDNHNGHQDQENSALKQLKFDEPKDDHEHGDNHNHRH